MLDPIQVDTNADSSDDEEEIASALIIAPRRVPPPQGRHVAALGYYGHERIPAPISSCVISSRRSAARSFDQFGEAQAHVDLYKIEMDGRVRLEMQRLELEYQLVMDKQQHVQNLERMRQDQLITQGWCTTNTVSAVSRYVFYTT